MKKISLKKIIFPSVFILVLIGCLATSAFSLPNLSSQNLFTAQNDYTNYDWEQDSSGNWYYRNSSTGETKAGWANNLPGYNGCCFYFDEDFGVMQTGWQNDIPGFEGKYFYFDINSGIMLTGLHDDIPGYLGSSFYFEQNSGVMQTSWCNTIPGYIGEYFYFDPNSGIMQTGWKNNIPGWTGKYFYFDVNSGIMQIGLQNTTYGWYGKCFYFDPNSGIMQTGWHSDIPEYYGSYLYFDEYSGIMQTGWRNDIPGWTGCYFYFEQSSGIMLTDLHNDIIGYEGKYFYFDVNSGVMQTGWQKNVPGYEGSSFYFNSYSGIMHTGWTYIDAWYYFNNDGTMLSNHLTPDGYFVGSDGKWIEKIEDEKYVIAFVNYDGTGLTTKLCTYGSTPDTPSAPSRSADEQYIYSFSGWSPSLTTVTSSTVYKATYIAISIKEINNKRTTLVNTALSQLGNVGGEKYWKDYGFESYVEWCACFVTWCAKQVNLINDNIIPKFALCQSGLEWFKSNGLWKDSSYIPATGDIIFFDYYGDGISSHTGIVEKVSGDLVYTVEGNSDDETKQRSYSLKDEHILGYGVPNYK